MNADGHRGLIWDYFAPQTSENLQYCKSTPSVPALKYAFWFGLKLLTIAFNRPNRLFRVDVGYIQASFTLYRKSLGPTYPDAIHTSIHNVHSTWNAHNNSQLTIAAAFSATRL